MRDSKNRKIEIGYRVSCDGGYSFDPSEGFVVGRWHVKLYKCSDKGNDDWNGREWTYEPRNLTIISEEKYLLDKLKE